MGTFRQLIRIDEDETATYERCPIVERTGDTGEVRVGSPIERKRIGARALLGTQGDLLMLPRRCCGFQQRGRVTVFLVEDPPDVHTVEWLTEGDAYVPMRQRLQQEHIARLFGEDPDAFFERIAAQHTFRVALPYLLWCYQFVDERFSKVLLYYRTRPTMLPADELSIPNLPNRHHDTHALCVTRRVKEELPQEQRSMAEAVGIVEREFWGSRWNQDWTHEFLADAARIPEVASPWEWERASHYDSTFVLRAPWRSAELTVAQVVDGLLSEYESAHTSHAFTVFAARVQHADPYDQAPPTGSDGVEVSPADAIVLTHAELRRGDRIDLVRGHFSECSEGGSFVVEWFSVPENKYRYVKCVGIDYPLRIIMDGKFVAGVTHHPQPSPPLTVAGHTIERGTIVQFHNHRQWPQFDPSAAYLIERARRDPSGAILVQMERLQLPGFLVLTDGDTLLAGCTVLPKERVERDGTLRDGFTLADGTKVQPGTRIYLRVNADGCDECLIEKIIGLRSGEGGHVCITTAGHRIRIDDIRGRLNDDCIIAPQDPMTAVPVGGRTVRLGDGIRCGGAGCTHVHMIDRLSPVFSDGRQFVRVDGGHWFLLAVHGQLARGISFPSTLVISDDRKTLRVGDGVFRAGDQFFDRQHGVLRTVETFSERRNSTDADVVCEDGHVLAFVRACELTERLQPAGASVMCGGVTCAPGLRMRLRKDAGEHRSGKRFVVAYVAASTERTPALAVLTCGLGFVLCRENMRCFQWRDGKTWRDFSNAVPEYPATPVHDVPGMGLCIGASVRYLGGISTIPYSTSEQMRVTGGQIVSMSHEACTVRFEQEIDGLSMDIDGHRRRASIPPAYLARVGVPLLSVQGFLRFFRRTEDVTCIEAGRVVGTDTHGRPLAVGDRVLVHRLSDRAHPAAVQHVLGHPCTIVHSTLDGFGGQTWLFLDAGCAVHGVPWGGNCGVPTDLDHDVTWWERIAFAQPKYCERIEQHAHEKQKGAA